MPRAQLGGHDHRVTLVKQISRGLAIHQVTKNNEPAINLATTPDNCFSRKQFPPQRITTITKRRKVAARGDEETRLAKHLSNIDAQQHQPAPLPLLVVVGAPQEVLAGFGKIYCDLNDEDPKMWRLEAWWAVGNRIKWTIEWYEDMAECAFVLLSRSPQRTKLVQMDDNFVYVFVGACYSSKQKWSSK